MYLNRDEWDCLRCLFLARARKCQLKRDRDRWVLFVLLYDVYVSISERVKSNWIRSKWWRLLWFWKNWALLLCSRFLSHPQHSALFVFFFFFLCLLLLVVLFSLHIVCFFFLFTFCLSMSNNTMSYKYIKNNFPFFPLFMLQIVCCVFVYCCCCVYFDCVVYDIVLVIFAHFCCF